jgi:hemolysin III
MDFLALREPASALSHGFGVVLAVAGTLLLWRRGRGDAGKRISLLIYGLCLIFCYTASTLYHGVPASGTRLDPFIRLDSVGIFALIAGSYTPLAWNLMRGRWRTWTLALVWGTAAVAIAVIASGHHFSPLLGTAIYLGMGWGVVVCYARLARVVSHRAMRLVVVGGLYYSVGAVMNLLRRPALWPGTFGTHDLFHLFVIAGSLAHYLFLLRVVVPFRWAPARPGSRPRRQALPADEKAPVGVA